MKIAMFIILLLPSIATRGQLTGNNSFVVNANTSLDFRYHSVEELLAPKVINNALLLQLAASGRNKNVAAHINFYNISPGEVPENWIMLRLINKNSPNAVIRNYETKLSSSPVLLFTQPGVASGEQNFSFNYDLVINPLTTFTKIGLYEYSITFTMTEP